MPSLNSHLFSLSLLLLLALPSLILATSSANLNLSSTDPPAQRFPRNLRRLYDGTWESSALPFATVPRPSDPRLTDPDQHLPLNATRRPAAPPPNHSLSFRKRSGFALLNVENHHFDPYPQVNLIFGELLLRDGPYRSQRDVSLRLIGIYELAAGRVVLVGDVLFEDVASALQRLFDAFEAARARNPSPANAPDFNITQEEFVDALRPPFTKHRQKFRSSRPGGAQRNAGVAAQCPFSATFNIIPGTYNDASPRQTEYTVYPSTAGPSGPAQVVAGPAGTSVLNVARADIASDLSPGLLPNTSGSHPATEQSLSGQDELVEMHGSFASEPCATQMTIILSTLDTETLFGKAINYTLLVTVVAFVQVIVLIRQMEMTSTQAGARRVSLMTVGLQAVADSYLCLGHLTMGIAVQTLFNAFATAAFFKFICFSIFLMRWMLLIWKARRPSGFSEGWEAMRRELSMLYSRFYGSLLLGIFLLYQMQNHLRFFLFALYSFWVPQIVLNVVEDHRRPLLPIYIIATSITRLAIPLYFWGCPHNFLHIQPQPGSALGLVGWLAVQATILLSQYKFGPRWFIPKAFLPKKYDYYRPIVLEEDSVKGDIEAQDGAVDGKASASEQQMLVGAASVEEPRRECCICMESVGIHSRERMVTPCNHFFHATCLERWLEVRLECALCRTAVPPP